ncbi:MAG: aryl-sulfate sulfotransferase [Eubacterium sp.]
MASNFVKRVTEKARRTYTDMFGTEIIIKSSKWMKEQAHKYDQMTKRDFNLNITSNINQRNSYPHFSRSVECAVNNLQKSGDYTLKKILVIKNPYKYAPLCALALFHTKKPYSVRVTVKGKTSDCDISYKIPATTEHKIPIMGLYADYENTVVMEFFNKSGRKIKTKDFILKMAPLKGKSSTIKVTKDLSEEKYLYDLTLVYGGDDGIYPYVFDRNGDIRYAFAKSPKTYGFQPISKGHFLFLNKGVTRLTFTNPASTQLFEVDQMGRFHKTYNIEKGAHHDFAELDNGNFVMGSNCVKGKTYEDTVIEVDRKNGQVLNEIKIKDYIDHKYVCTSDWAHLNSIEYNTDEKTVMVNLRNLHSVMKINYEKQELMWILGHPTYWENSTVSDKVLTPQGENMKWFFQAHAAYFVDADLDGNPDTKHLIIYDNHTQKRVPVDYYDNDEQSSVKIYTINENAKTVSLYKSFSFERSNIRSNGILEEKAGRVMAMNGKLQNKEEERNSSIIEFDYRSEKVLNQYSMNYGFYRAYEFQFEPDEMVKAIDLDEEYSLGRVYDLKTCEQIDTSSAKTLPEPVLEDGDQTEEDRKQRLMELARKNAEYYVDPEQDMARITMVLEEDILYVNLLDHQLEQIYFIGENNTYFRELSDTRQERPEYFARAGNTDAIPLNNLKDDSYQIYFKHSTGLYKSKHYVKISKNEDR